MRKALFLAAVLSLSSSLCGVAQAGCVSGALKGAVIGHFMHHGVAGAAVGCAAAAAEAKNAVRAPEARPSALTGAAVPRVQSGVSAALPNPFGER